MKTVLISLMTMLGVAVGSAGVTATSLFGNLSSEVSVSYNNLSTSGGLGIRDESVAYSLATSIPLEGADVHLALDLHDVDGGWERDWSVAFSRPVEVFGQKLGLEVFYNNVDSSFGPWDEVGVAAVFDGGFADVTASFWKELGSNAPYGVELIVSRDFDTPVENLTLTPFVAVNVAEEYNGVEAGVSATYDWNGVSVFLKGSYNHNDLDGSDPYSLDHDWHFGGGVSYKF